VLPFHATCREAAVPVACYPRGWDSVSFYLGRTDVRIYPKEQRHRMIADLHRQRRTLLFVRSGRDVEELLRALPETVEFAPERQGQGGEVVVGWVRVRPRPK
jgi:hypothetical protein